MPTPSLTKNALDFIKKMQHKHAKQVLLKILELCGNPTPPDSQKLEGNSEGYRRADIGEYRIVYRVAGDILEVLLIGKRNDDEVVGVKHLRL
ncbi:MAG: type II toxin-antitoxin system RelE/ParE family toxin [Armatimonadota bacterium]|nr:type II toxin-antitoxin system RelE/ParE family toxin [Armatimonadota bacterium]